MGYRAPEANDWKDFKRKHIEHAKTVDDIFTSRTMKAAYNPREIKIRESCDSPGNPESDAIIIGCDITGSMDRILDQVIRTVLPNLFTDIYERKPVPYPHLLAMGIGDVEAGDRAPLQTTQFESDIKIAEQLKEIYLERGGGGNNYESYALAWYFAGYYTRIDCFEKRRKKGFLFTMGDEEPTPYLTKRDITKVFGSANMQSDKLTQEELLQLATRQYHVYHLMLTEGFNYSNTVKEKWTRLLGQNAMLVDDYRKIGEIITSTLQMHAGVSKEEIIKSWDGSTAVVVEKAISHLSVTPNKTDELITF